MVRQIQTKAPGMSHAKPCCCDSPLITNSRRARQRREAGLAQNGAVMGSTQTQHQALAPDLHHTPSVRKSCSNFTALRPLDDGAVPASQLPSQHACTLRARNEDPNARQSPTPPHPTFFGCLPHAAGSSSEIVTRSCPTLRWLWGKGSAAPPRHLVRSRCHRLRCNTRAHHPSSWRSTRGSEAVLGCDPHF